MEINKALVFLLLLDVVNVVSGGKKLSGSRRYRNSHSPGSTVRTRLKCFEYILLHSNQKLSWNAKRKEKGSTHYPSDPCYYRQIIFVSKRKCDILQKKIVL